MRAAIAGDVLSCSDDADVIGNSSDNCVAQPFRTLAAEALGACASVTCTSPPIDISRMEPVVLPLPTLAWMGLS